MDQTQRDCQRCIARKADGRRCSRTTCLYSELCWQHAGRDLGLKIAPSTIPGAGRGLFATRDLPRNYAIRYGRPIDRLTRAEIHARYPNNQVATYGLCSANRCVDGRSTQSGLARWVNAPRGTNRRSNSALTMLNTNNPWAARATLTRAVRQGEEILTNYGAAYWRAHP